MLAQALFALALGPGAVSIFPLKLAESAMLCIEVEQPHQMSRVCHSGG